VKVRLHLIVALALLAACGTSEPACPPEAADEGALVSSPTDPADTPMARPQTPVEMEIGGRRIAVDQVVRGPLCEGDWSGIVYVTCDVEVRPWEERPTFLEGCDLSIAPDTVVYVADHNDAAYYNGCSCHTGEIGQP
jgi:hypothetical protein